jgi:hypothetical protein
MLVTPYLRTETLQLKIFFRYLLNDFSTFLNLTKMTEKEIDCFKTQRFEHFILYILSMHFT